MRKAALMLWTAALLASCATAAADNRLARCEFRSDQWSRAECERARQARAEQQQREEIQRERVEQARENRRRDAPAGADLVQIGY